MTVDEVSMQFVVGCLCAASVDYSEIVTVHCGRRREGDAFFFSVVLQRRRGICLRFAQVCFGICLVATCRTFFL